MKKSLTLPLVIFIILPALLMARSSVSSQAVPDMRQTVASGSYAIVNIDGDVSLTGELDEVYWNPHSTGLTTASKWKVSFNNETEIFLKTTANEAGHVATGAWWTTGFKSGEKLQLYTSKPVQIAANFQASVVAVNLESGDEWLRVALACAIQRFDGSVVYTEMDFWDSPSVVACENGNVRFGGNVVYEGGDVVEYKVEQAVTGKWTDYSLSLTQYINSAWLLKSGDVLESVYVVVEVVGATEVTVKVDDFWIAQFD